MRTLRLPLAGTLCLVVTVAVLPPAAVMAQGDDPAAAMSESPGEVTVVGNLVYATGRAPEEATELTLLLVRPATWSEDAPVVIDVGGSAANPMALAERGVSVFSAFIPDREREVKARADPTALRAMVDAVACAVRFARGSEYGSETAPLVLTGWSRFGGPPAHVALAGEDFDRVWDEYEASGGGPPPQYDCTVADASTRVDAFVGVAGTYEAFVGYEGLYGRDFLLEHEPDLWEMLDGTVGLHPELRVRLLHGISDSTVPLESSAAFEKVLGDAGYDVELIEFEGGHGAPSDLVTETVTDLVS